MQSPDVTGSYVESRRSTAATGNPCRCKQQQLRSTLFTCVHADRDWPNVRACWRRRVNCPRPHIASYLWAKHNHYLTINWENTNLSCRREAARRSVSLEILLSHSRSLKVIRN